MGEYKAKVIELSNVYFVTKTGKKYFVFGVTLSTGSISRTNQFSMTNIPPSTFNQAVGLERPDAELVFGLVNPVGVDYSDVLATLENYIKHFHYTPKVISLSEYIGKLAKLVDLESVKLDDSNEGARVNSYMSAGNEIRKRTESAEFVVAGAIAGINRERPIENGLKSPCHRVVHILKSLKRPEEADLLRRVYGLGFYLIGINATEDQRLSYLTNDQNIDVDAANKLIERDANEEEHFGQRTRATFQLADVFVSLNGDYKDQITRFLELVFGHPFHTPLADEHAMFLAYAASLRSSQLGRQVGAAIRSEHGDIIATGCNDVPRPGGGLYWPGEGDQRDHVKKIDSNDKQLKSIIKDVIDRLKPFITVNADILNPSEVFKGSLLLDVTEFGRAVHAEMDALLTCARVGVSPQNADLFTTTFPCHNCTRHIIAAGIKRVIFIEPYPKSLAKELHEDAITVDKEKPTKQRVPFEPFVGVGPRRFFDLFSMKLSRGYEMVRKNKGEIVNWERSKAMPRIQMLPSSYIQREQLAADRVKVKIDELKKQERLI